MSADMDRDKNVDGDHRSCELCLTAKSKYTCPRCNVPYCSVECYKGEKHLQCSESFYKDCFMDGLNDMTASHNEKEKMKEMLAKVEKEQNTEVLNEDDDEPDLHERLEGLDLDGDTELIWSRLTEEEKKDFEKLAQNGGLGSLIETWTPWWTVKDDKLVRDIDEKPCVEGAPKIPYSIPDISSLIKNIKPSAEVKFTAVCALYAYCFVSRLHNGCHMENPVDSADEVLNLSNIDSKNVNHFSVGEAIQACLQKTHDPMFGEVSLKCSISIVTDIICVVEGPGPDQPLMYITMALSELLTVFNKARKLQSSGVQKFAKGEKSLRKKIFAAEKKLEFLLSWTQRFGMSLHTLIPELELEYGAAMSEIVDVEKDKVKLEKSWGGKQKSKPRKLVEEIL